MEIETITHKGLRRFFETGVSKGLVDDINRIRKMLAFINAAGNFHDLSRPPTYDLRDLSRDKTGLWAMTVTKNWRLTFIKINETMIGELNLEDDH